MTNDNNAQANPSPEGAVATSESPDLETLQAELAKVRDDMLRALAEAENTRRRSDRQVQDARSYAIDRFAGDLLPVADSLTRAIAAAPRDSTDEALRNLLAGLELTERALLDVFARHGLKRIGAKGDAFDPNLHQAVAHAPSDEPQGAVLDVMQPGYVLGDRTLRAAMVSVSAGASGAPPPAPTIDIKV
jgi:molecular chaperone GrpE